MRYLNKILVSLSLLATMLLTGCNTDQEGPVYKESAEGLGFSSSALTSQVVTLGTPTFTVDLYRVKAGEALSGSVSIFAYKLAADKKTQIPQEGYTVSGFSFAADATMTSVTVDATPLSVGDNVTIELTVATENVALGGSNVATMAVTKDYSWKSIGTGIWRDGVISSIFDVPAGVTWEVEVEEAEELSGMYRVTNPYGYGKCPWVEEAEVTVDPCYVKIDASDPTEVYLANQGLGFAWDYGEFMLGSVLNVGYPGVYGTKNGKEIDFGTLFVAMGGDIYSITAGGGLTLP